MGHRAQDRGWDCNGDACKTEVGDWTGMQDREGDRDVSSEMGDGDEDGDGDGDAHETRDADTNVGHEMWMGTGTGLQGGE